jgi:hypothetical protein
LDRLALLAIPALQEDRALQDLKEYKGLPVKLVQQDTPALLVLEVPQAHKEYKV